jgi:hypothetical protein
MLFYTKQRAVFLDVIFKYPYFTSKQSERKPYKESICVCMYTVHQEYGSAVTVKKAIFVLLTFLQLQMLFEDVVNKSLWGLTSRPRLTV